MQVGISAIERFVLVARSLSRRLMIPREHTKMRVFLFSSIRHDERRLPACEHDRLSQVSSKSHVAIAALPMQSGKRRVRLGKMSPESWRPGSEPLVPVPNDRQCYLGHIVDTAIGKGVRPAQAMPGCSVSRFRVSVTQWDILVNVVGGALNLDALCGRKVEGGDDEAEEVR